MRLIIISLLALFVTFTPFVHAQKSVQEILMSQHWYEEPVPDAESRLANRDSRVGYDFNKGTLKKYPLLLTESGTVSAGATYPYYLSDTPPDSIFDKGRVGKTTNGKYLIVLEIRLDGSERPFGYEIVDINEQYIKLWRYDPKRKENPVYRIWRPRP